jgi:hypothetical protein
MPSPNVCLEPKPGQLEEQKDRTHAHEALICNVSDVTSQLGRHIEFETRSTQ